MKSNKPTPSGGNKQPTAPPHGERVIAAADAAESLVNEPQDVFEARLHNFAKDHKVSRDEILDELANRGVQHPEPGDTQGEHGEELPLPLIDLARSDWSAPPPPRRWLVQDYFLWGKVAMLTGEGGAGKTQLALQLAYSIAAGRSDGEQSHAWFAGGPEIAEGYGPVVYATWEEEAAELQRRMLRGPAYHHAGARELHEHLGGRFYALDLAARGPLWQPAGKDGAATGALTPLGVELQAMCEEVGACLLVIDALDSAYACNENDRPVVRAFLNCWNEWGSRSGCAPLIVAHPPKTEANYSGSTAWRNGPRAMLNFKKEPEGRATLEITKSNNSAPGAKITLTDWSWWRGLDPDVVKAETAAAKAERFATLKAALEDADGPLNSPLTKSSLDEVGMV